MRCLTCDRQGVSRLAHTDFCEACADSFAMLIQVSPQVRQAITGAVNLHTQGPVGPPGVIGLTGAKGDKGDPGDGVPNALIYQLAKLVEEIQMKLRVMEPQLMAEISGQVEEMYDRVRSHPPF